MKCKGRDISCLSDKQSFNKVNMRSYTLENDVKVLSCKKLYSGFININEYRLKYRCFDKNWSKIVYRESSARGEVAAVLPYDSKLDKVVLIEQFRIGALYDSRSPWLLEIVAGIAEPNESIEDLAIRETYEETGLKIKKLDPVYCYWASPGGSNQRVSLYCAEVDSTKANGIHGLKEENEDIRVHTFSCEEAFAMVREGLIIQSPAIIALQWLELKRNGA